MQKISQKTINNSQATRFIDVLALEGENVEFKEAKNSYEFDTLVKCACAVFGITDAAGKRLHSNAPE